MGSELCEFQMPPPVPASLPEMVTKSSVAWAPVDGLGVGWPGAGADGPTAAIAPPKPWPRLPERVELVMTSRPRWFTRMPPDPLDVLRAIVLPVMVTVEWSPTKRPPTPGQAGDRAPSLSITVEESIVTTA